MFLYNLQGHAIRISIGHGTDAVGASEANNVKISLYFFVCVNEKEMFEGIRHCPQSRGADAFYKLRTCLSL